ncbi:pantetheine-phosphate adenylyltransferase [Thalassoglobus polymorphus]|uniref:Phosphopantetheine adenylyltransferase n=1 Tax=Thalassoglobus polymorphus TaxID=2527994 RepID=A0A517QSX8_9PLAN|nr:pantetheine-phosphate adenylyltransferase [Thalassoglobus polymorphus]QDT34730.1 Phosphopantetheine adenylyltransferase [Thalassoglobus polymorphus]
MKRIAVYAGTFDPVTLGHEDIAIRGAALFDEMVIGIGINPDKQPLFAPEERQELMQEIFRETSNVTVKCFTGLTVDFARSVGANVMVRGVRTVSDIDTEFTMALANHTIAPDLETVFLMAAESYSHISSTLIKQIAFMGQGKSAEQLRKFVPEPVMAPLLDKVRNSG